ncbi:MAG: hypothetical protein OXH38_12685 [Chloroflexi bacterium]|nr:hypothetical protein [Chloroflexota bacterium]
MSDQSEQTATDRYFDALLASYDALHDAVEQANERGLRLSRQLAADITDAQRRAIELARQVAANPSDSAAAYSAIMESAVAAQSQALDFTQSAYKEALAAGSEGREALDALLGASRAAAEAALAASRDWQSATPWSDFVQKSMEPFGLNPNGASEEKEEAGTKA